MGKGRKKRDEIWKHYRVGPDKSVICKYCDHKYKIANVNKMGGHLVKCDKCPVIVKNDLKNQTDVNITNTTNAPVITTASSHPAPHIGSLDSENSNLCLNQPSSSSQTQSTEEEDIERLTVKFAKAVFISGSPLSLVEHPLWIDFFTDLQPLFKLPSRKNLSTTLLDKVYTEIKKEVMECLKTTSYLHLQCDGWTNVNNEGVINFIISNPEPYFVKSLSTEDNRHTSLYLSEEIIKVMRVYGESKFVALIGDNARNLQKAFQLVKNNIPQVVLLNCAAHTLSLLTHDIIKCEVIKGVIELATDVVKTIKKSQLSNSLLKKIIKEKKTGETIKLPVKTRWGSHVSSLKSLNKTKAALLALAIHEAAVIPSETKSTLLDDSFWNMIEDCIAILEPVTEPIFKLEANECNIHKVFPMFKDVKSKLEFMLPNITIISNEDKQTILNSVEKRTKDCIKPIHLAAYLLDPNTQGLTLNENEDLDAMEFIKILAQNHNFDVVTDLANYKARDGFWRKRFIWEKVEDISPVTWWKGLCSSKNLSKIAVRILTAPCTSAATERSFSKHGHIHSKKRNRLTSERAAKLAFASYNWDLLYKFNQIVGSEDSESPEDRMTPDRVQNIEQSGENQSSEDDRRDDNRNNLTTEENILARKSPGHDIEFFDCGSNSSSNSSSNED